MEQHAALMDAYLKLKKRWRTFLKIFLLLILVLVVFSSEFGDLAVPLAPLLGIALIGYAFLCYAAQFVLLHEMAMKVHFPRVGNHELGFWYTLMLLALLTSLPGMILEVSLFLLYARKFISNTNIARLETTPQP
jgi:hypothetical protein